MGLRHNDHIRALLKISVKLSAFLWLILFLCWITASKPNDRLFVLLATATPFLFLFGAGAPSLITYFSLLKWRPNDPFRSSRTRKFLFKCDKFSPNLLNSFALKYLEGTEQRYRVRNWDLQNSDTSISFELEIRQVISGSTPIKRGIFHRRVRLKAHRDSDLHWQGFVSIEPSERRVEFDHVDGDYDFMEVFLKEVGLNGCLVDQSGRPIDFYWNPK